VIDQNLQDIIALKKANPDKVVLLWGNHDIQYLYYPEFRCNGYRDSMKRPLRALFTYNKDLFQVAYQSGNHLFTHAGVTNAWYQDFKKLPKSLKEDGHETLADIFNKTDNSNNRWILYKAGYSRNGTGNGGITWADRSETWADMLFGYHQVVGHTPMEDVECWSYEDTFITYLDVLDTKIYFHKIDC
jgi:hypothetical protein